MSKNSKSRSNRSRKKKNKARNSSPKRRDIGTEQQVIEETVPVAPEQLNTETEEAVPEVEAKLYEQEPETPVFSDAQDTDVSLQSSKDGNVDAPAVEPEEIHEIAEADTQEEQLVEEQEKDIVQEPEVSVEDDDVDRNTDEGSESVTVTPAKKTQNIGKEKKIRKKHTGMRVLAVLAVVLVYCAAVIYGFFWVDDNIIDPDIYPDGTTINSIDVSGMDLKEAKEALTEDWNTHSISIFDSSGKEIGEIDDFNFKYEIDDQLEHALSPGAETALMRLFEKKKDDIIVKMDPSGSTESFDKQFNDLSIVKEAEGDKPSKNAYIDKSDTEFRIVKEVIGNSVDTSLLEKAVLDAIAEGNETFEFRRSDYHKLPDIVSTSESLLEERKYCIKYLSFTIRLRNPVNDYTIPPSWLDKMIKVSDKGKVTVSDEQVSQFISEVVYPKFSSVGDTRRLKSAGGGHYTITGGTYGYTIDVEKEHSVLSEELKARENVEREPNYAGKAPGDNWKNDIGNDYVEVSIDKQNCWVVRNGKIIVDTPVVTGVLPRHATPEGVFYIVYKATNTTLKGRNDDGSKYESHVAYWMPFYLGFGLHDASWRGAFGGSIYVHGGSHGCVNCPPSIMPKIFSNCYEGMPVIVH